MPWMASASRRYGLFHALCPRCREGRIFRGPLWRGFARMHERCQVCGLKYEREAGYFLGAMYISYILGVLVIAAWTALLWALTGWSFVWVLLAGALAFLPLLPTVTLASRVLWIYLDRAIDPE